MLSKTLNSIRNSRVKIQLKLLKNVAYPCYWTEKTQIQIGSRNCKNVDTERYKFMSNGIWQKNGEKSKQKFEFHESNLKEKVNVS